MRQTLNVDIKNDKQENYEIVISDDLFSKLKEDIDLFTSGANRLVVISQKVYKLYKKELNFDRKEVFVLKDGEIQKNFKNYEKILKKAFDLGLTRKDYIIAVGGGGNNGKIEGGIIVDVEGGVGEHFVGCSNKSNAAKATHI